VIIDLWRAGGIFQEKMVVGGGTLPAAFEVDCRLLGAGQGSNKEPRMRALGTQRARSKAGGQEGPSPDMEQKKGAHAPLFHNADLLVGIARLHLGGLRTNRERILLSRKSDLVQGFLAVGIEHGYR
jgi:hypothetical protein